MLEQSCTLFSPQEQFCIDDQLFSAKVAPKQAATPAEDTSVELQCLDPESGASRTFVNSRKASRKDGKQSRVLRRKKMKFSHSLQFNAVADWTDKYIAYSSLKKLIYTLERQTNQQTSITSDAEGSPLLENGEEPDVVFSHALNVELEKICAFYREKESEIVDEAHEVLRDATHLVDSQNNEGEQLDGLANSHTLSRASRSRQNSLVQSVGFGPKRQTGFFTRSFGLEDDDDSEDDYGERSVLNRPRTKDGHIGWDSQVSEDIFNPEPTVERQEVGQSWQETSDRHPTTRSPKARIKKRVISVYVSLCELRSYAQLNETGFSKVLKKYDKTLDRKLKQPYINEFVRKAYPFKQETLEELGEIIHKVEMAYATLATKGNLLDARRDLRLHLREHVVWERNTVWRDMIGIERRAQAANIGTVKLLVHENGSRKIGDQVIAIKNIFRTPFGQFDVPDWLCHSSAWCLLSSLVSFTILLSTPIMAEPEQQNCLAMIVLVSLLWATEAIPLFVTSLLVPFLVVVLRVVRDPDSPQKRLDTKETASFIFSAMWTSVIMLLLGGFTIAAALSKHNVAKRMATFVLSKAGTKPRVVLLTSMFIAMVSSMLISNVAAPVLCYSILQPILRNLPDNSNMSKALVLGIALASNIGGAVSPIASPQNLIALQNMNPVPGWGVWFFVSIPVCILSIILIWLLLMFFLRPGRGTVIVSIRSIKEPYTGTQWFIIIVTLVTITLWCVSHRLQPIFGDMGVMAIIPLVLFFGTGILTKEDFNNFLWTIIILAAGGLALGKAVTSSGLLHTIAEGITARVGGLSLYVVLISFASLILCVATFISHTVAALIVLPLVRDVGMSMQNPHPNLLVMASVLVCSAAMGLPTSGFPNMTAVMMEDQQTGYRYLGVKDFLAFGIPSSMLTCLVIVTLGYGLMLIVGF